MGQGLWFGKTVYNDLHSFIHTARRICNAIASIRLARILSEGPSLACKTSSFHACIDLPPVAIQGPWAAGQKAENRL